MNVTATEKHIIIIYQCIHTIIYDDQWYIIMIDNVNEYYKMLICLLY